MKKTLLGFCVVIYTLLFGEAFIRLMAPVALMPRYVTAAPYGVRMNVPNAHYWQTTPETRVQIRINEQGIRTDRKYPYQKPAGLCRILMLGDSYFAGYEVKLEDSFAFLLEQRLNAAGYPCEVINLAVSGFGTAEMLATTQAEGLKYQPDIIVFQWHGTDRSDNLRAASLYHQDAAGHLIRTDAAYLPGVALRDWLSQFAIYRFLIENSQFYSAIREAISVRTKALLAAIRRRKAPADEAAVESSPHPARKNYAEELSLQLLEEARRTSTEHQARFCVLEIPTFVSRTHFTTSLWPFDRETQKRLNMFSPLAEFSRHADPQIKIYYEQGHFHLTPLGNRLLTDYFLTQLENAGWLEKFRHNN